MNKKAYKALEYYKIIDLLTDKASSPMGKDLCRKLTPSTDIEEIRSMQLQTHDALARLFKKGGISFGSVKDIRGTLKRLTVGSALNAPELLSVCSLLENTGRVKAYSRSDRDDGMTDSLDGMFAALEPLTPLSTEIRRCILSEDEISDDASSTLRQIRRSIKATNDRIHTQLSSLVAGSARNYLQDSVITMRDGRYCIPVKAEYKGQVPGMIHDQSATGSTLFIEPMAVVKLNNDIRELELKEQKEIEVILASLSQQVAAELEAIHADLSIMVQLDFIFARAALAMDMNASEPIFNIEGRIRLRQARHPLIDKKKAVPIDIRLGDDFDLLVVTGPNTGGKTVSLKTVGLLTMMGQSGLHIPALDRSELALFREVYADIGDEQSIEQSLSTFSSHMTNVVSFLKSADQDSLVLFDELGAGTDPTEGAALAIAILSHLHEQGIRTMATTHYSELKVFALTTPGVENACCEFNVETLQPTYRLLIGVPGKSNAFAISKKLGLPDYIIEDAKNHLEAKDESFEDLLTSLENSRVTIEKEQEEIRSYKEEIAQLKSRLTRKEEHLDERKDKVIRNATEEAQRILREAKETADQTIRQINKLAADSGINKELEAQRTKLREQLKKTDDKLAVKAKGPSQPVSAKKLKIGDGVKVLSMNLKGTVSSLPDSTGNLFVQMGILRSKVNIRDIELIREDDISATLGDGSSRSYGAVSGVGISKSKKTFSQAKGSNSGSGQIKMSKSFSVSPEVNLIGMTTDEAVPTMEKYLDDAYLAHLPSVRVVHGRGTGALKTACHKRLKQLKYVKDFRLGEFGEGGTGVTIVTFK